MTQKNKYEMTNSNDRIIPAHGVYMTPHNSINADGSNVLQSELPFAVHNIETGKVEFFETVIEAQRVSWRSIAPAKTPVLDALREFISDIVEEQVGDMQHDIETIQERIEENDDHTHDDLEDRLSAVESIIDDNVWQDLHNRMREIEEQLVEVRTVWKMGDANSMTHTDLSSVRDALMEIGAVVERRMTQANSVA